MITAVRPQREATILYRVALKQHPGIVVWQVLSGDGVTKYDVTLVRGKVNSCNQDNSNEPCQGWKYRHSCGHSIAAQQAEDERSARMREFYCQNFGIYA